MKHVLLSPPLPPAKRLHTSGSPPPAHVPKVVALDQVFTDEIVLCIFSHLDWVDLCVTQTTSRNWARLAADNELWRSLYMKVYGRTRLRGARGFIDRLDGREVKALPGRTRDGNIRNWKWMFRVSSNWRKGRCMVEAFDPSDRQERDRETHILLAGPLTITASARPSLHPEILLHLKPTQEAHTLISHTNLASPASITTICLDQSPPTSNYVSVVCFLSTGEFNIFRLNPNNPGADPRKICTYSSPPGRRPQNRIVQAAYYYPLLVALSDDFELSIYDLSSDSVRRTQSLSSFTSYPPSSLILSAPSPTTFKLVLAYSIPVYPNHWSAGATELIVSKDGAQAVLSSTSPFASPPAFAEDLRLGASTSSMSVVAMRTIRAIDVPSGWIDERRLRSMREQWARKVSSVAGTQTDGKWLVLAPGTTSNGNPNPPPPDSPTSFNDTHLHTSSGLQLYRLVLPPSSNVAPSPPKLTFIRMLYGQTSAVSALALADGRCVSLGCDGSIWVWDLENGTGAEVAPADEASWTSSSREGAISFDERRIVTACAGKLAARRFDI